MFPFPKPPQRTYRLAGLVLEAACFPRRVVENHRLAVSSMTGSMGMRFPSGLEEDKSKEEI